MKFYYQNDQYNLFCDKLMRFCGNRGYQNDIIYNFIGRVVCGISI